MHHQTVCWSLPRSGRLPCSVLLWFFEEISILKKGYILIWLSCYVTRELRTGQGLSGFVVYNSPTIDFYLYFGTLLLPIGKFYEENLFWEKHSALTFPNTWVFNGN